MMATTPLILQFVLITFLCWLACCARPLVQVRHGHDLDHKTSPAGEMLGPLACSGLRVILFPSKAGGIPGFEDGVHNVSPQAGKECARAVFMLRIGAGDVLLTS